MSSSGKDLHDKKFVADRTEGFEEIEGPGGEVHPEPVCRKSPASRRQISRRPPGSMPQSKPAAILYSMGITQHASGHATVLAIANLAMLSAISASRAAG